MSRVKEKDRKAVVYDKMFYRVVEDRMVSAFEMGPDMLPDIDIPWMLWKFLGSEYVKKLEEGLSHYMNIQGSIAITTLLDKEKDYPQRTTKKEEYSFALSWMAKFFTYMSFSYDLPCEILSKHIKFEDLYNPCLYYMNKSMENTARDYYNKYIKSISEKELKDKKNNFVKGMYKKHTIRFKVRPDKKSEDTFDNIAAIVIRDNLIR